jgi:hypothetical protein
VSDLDLFWPSAAPQQMVTTVAPVRGVDAPHRLVQVLIPGGGVMWLAAQPGRYRVSDDSPGVGLARVLLDPDSRRPVLVIGPVDPLDPVVPASMTASGETTATVSWNGAAYDLPFLPASYGTLPRDVWIGLTDWGVPNLVHGPSPVAPPPPPPPPTPPPSATVQVTQTIGPQWSGSYRHVRGAWDRWNTTRYGGRSTLYQGNGQGSGPMTGLAVYGNQLVNLGAISIDRVRVRLRNVGLASGSPAVTVQGSPNGTPPGGAPSASGATASGMDTWLDLPSSVREAMRTGAVKGLATVGGSYSAVAGAGNGDGMVLSVTYTRNA